MTPDDPYLFVEQTDEGVVVAAVGMVRDERIKLQLLTMLTPAGMKARDLRDVSTGRIIATMNRQRMERIERSYKRDHQADADPQA